MLRATQKKIGTIVQQDEIRSFPVWLIRHKEASYVHMVVEVSFLQSLVM